MNKTEKVFIAAAIVILLYQSAFVQDNNVKQAIQLYTMHSYKAAEAVLERIKPHSDPKVLVYYSATKYHLGDEASAERIIRQICQTITAAEAQRLLGQHDDPWNDFSSTIWKDCMPSIRVEISSQPSNAKIIIDGEKLDSKTNASVHVATGQHTIIVKKGWFRKKQQSFTANADTSLFFDLKRNPLKIAGTAVAGLAIGAGVYKWSQCCKDNGHPLPAPPDPPKY